MAAAGVIKLWKGSRSSGWRILGFGALEGERGGLVGVALEWVHVGGGGHCEWWTVGQEEGSWGGRV